MARIPGPALGDLLRTLNEAHGVAFYLGYAVGAIEERCIRLDDGAALDADPVLVGIGVRPRLALAEKAGLAVGRGVLIDEDLVASAPDVFAASDIARRPDPYSDEWLRIEHWVVAKRQGQTAALNMLGRRERCAAVPFFWRQHYDISIDHGGHAAGNRIAQDGDSGADDVALRFQTDGRTLVLATIFRGRDDREVKCAMELGRSR